jgi:pyruvate dehydrogenase E2 component (dihydrolipoamide acetyltransferase)
MGQKVEIELPDIGDFHDVEVIEVLVAVGDQVAVEDSLIALESDKATMEIPAPQAGVVQSVNLAVGDKINQGDVILTLEMADEASAEAEVVEKETTEPAASADSAPSSAPTVESAAASTRGPIPITVPDIGDFKDVEVVEVLVSEGDAVAAEDSLITLETDKASMEIPSPHAGQIQQIKVNVGDRINEGDEIALMVVVGAIEATASDKAPSASGAADTAPSAAQASAPPASAPEQRAAGEKEAQRRPVVAKPSDAPKGKAHASPAIRRFARELGVDLYHVPGSGAKGRIIKEDVQAYVKRSLAEAGAATTSAGGGGEGWRLPAQPEVDFSQFGEIEEKPLGRIKKLSGKHLHNAWLGIPHVTQFDEADITELEAFRKGQKSVAEKQGVKLTFMPFLMKALAAAMREYPQFNASLAPNLENLIYKQYCHIGVAVDTPNGLVVPVVRDVDQKGVFDLARDLMALSSKAREGKLSPKDMQGGCLSISSLGGIGGVQFTPIVNSPEVAILGVSKAQMQPKWDGDEFQPRLIMPFSLSYDHRVIDGAEGVRFSTYLANLLGDIRRLVL